MKPLVIYHDNCADGFGAAFAAWLKFGDHAEYMALQYPDTINQALVYNREVYILDFSFPRYTMDAVFADAKRVVWLDHHKTAFELYGLHPNGKDELWVDDENPAFNGIAHSMDRIVLDNNHSGAMLAWSYFQEATEPPMLIKHIDDYDRWQFKLEGTKEFNKALWSYAPWSFEQWAGIVSLPPEDYYMEGAAILRAHEQNVAAVVKGAGKSCNISYVELELQEDSTKRSIQHYVMGLAANCPPHLASDVGHQLATQSGTYGLVWYVNKEGKCMCSLRSNGDYDVSTIAKAFGGGGHKNAAGFEVGIQTLLEWIK